MPKAKSLRRKFIEMCRDGHFALQFILDRLAIPPATLHRWFRQPGFRRQLRRAMATAEKRRELEIQLGGNKAAERMTRMSTGIFSRSTPPLEIERLASVNLISLARFKFPKRVAKGKRATEPNEMPRDLAHPDIAERGEEILAELELSRKNAE